MSIVLILIILVLLGGGIWGWPLLAGILGIAAVTDKPGALEQIRQLMTTHDISPDEVESYFISPPSGNAKASQRSKGDIAKTLFVYLGAIFILAGISTYIGMFWESMGSAMRVIVTLGVGYILLIVLISALYEKKYPRAIFPLTFACVFMLVGGWFVLIDELFPNGDNWRAALLFVSGTMVLHWGGLFGKYQNTVFAFIALVFTYLFMHVGLDMLGVSFTYIAIILGSSLFLVGSALEKTPPRVLAEPALLIGAFWLNGGLFDLVASTIAANWASFIVGSGLMLTAYGLYRADRYPRLIGLGYLAGSIMFYAGLFDLVENTSIELLFLGLTATVLYVSVVLQSKVLLFTTVLAMLSYIAYFSAEHFSDSLGWPITLVLIGIAFMGVGTIAIRLKQKI